jgi:hypothetical protein
MPAFDFKCHDCSGLIFETRTSQPLTCPQGHTSIERIYDFQGMMGRTWDGGFSPTIGRYAPNEYAVSEGLKAASEAASEQLGIEHRFKTIDPRELPTTDA